MQNRRSKRRKAWKKREYLNQYAEKLISKDYLWASSTWSGSRCPDCGIKTEPRYHLGKKFVNLTSVWRTFGFLPICDRVQNCRGEVADWQDKLI